MTADPVTSYDVDEAGVALLRLDRPEARNAINTQMLEEMLGHLATARDDEARPGPRALLDRPHGRSRPAPTSASSSTPTAGSGAWSCSPASTTS